MYSFAVMIVLLIFQSINGEMKAPNETSENGNDNDQYKKPPASIDETRLNMRYWNSYLGINNSVKITTKNESQILDNWIDGLPLKVITHGWLVSHTKLEEENFNSGVFSIKTAYVKTGGYNIITVDWSSFGNDLIYPEPAVLTTSIGYAIAKFLDRLVEITNLNASDIHLIGHSLGAHVCGTCGSYFKHGKIGRITGLDPASLGFELRPINLAYLNEDDGVFVDVIHTTGWKIGFTKRTGHADFYPNGGVAPQPGCFTLLTFLNSISCSHSRAYELYADSVYHKDAFFAVECSSWIKYDLNMCTNNTKEQMGHSANPSARGKFYLDTKDSSPYATS